LRFETGRRVSYPSDRLRPYLIHFKIYLMRIQFAPLLKRLFLVFSLSATVVAAESRWSEKRATTWYQNQPWLVGANYNPATAINELEMWQPETFDPATIEKELAWAESIGMNTMRVFLHDLLWQQDPAGFKRRIDKFLQISSRHGIKPMFVLFDSCWDPQPKLGRQREPTPGVHNSGWVQSPGAKALSDPSHYPRLRAYVKGVVGAFAKDSRVLAWDVWNEPDNTNDPAYIRLEPKNKIELVENLLPQVFKWTREANPSQPLTSGVWRGEWSSEDRMTKVDKIQIANSDLVSFHNYSTPEDFEKRVKWLMRYNRPLLCTEYMARSAKSTFQGSLPIAKKYGVAAYNWGLVAGKTQTYLPWDSWQKPYVNREPSIWFHEVFRSDGTPYSKDEVDLIRALTSGERKFRPGTYNQRKKAA
jgi:hypothetical protein